MKAIALVHILSAALFTFYFAGVIDVVYVLRPNLLFILYGFLLVIAVFTSLYTAKSPRRSAVMGAIAFGLAVGFASDVCSRAFGDYEKYIGIDSFIEGKFFEFQSNGCEGIASTYGDVRVQVSGFGSESGMKQRAIILVAYNDGDVTRMVSMDSYQRVRRSSERHGLGWIFNYFRKGVFTWDVRQATCVH